LTFALGMVRSELQHHCRSWQHYQLAVVVVVVVVAAAAAGLSEWWNPGIQTDDETLTSSADSVTDSCDINSFNRLTLYTKTACDSTFSSLLFGIGLKWAYFTKEQRGERITIDLHMHVR